MKWICHIRVNKDWLLVHKKPFNVLHTYEVQQNQTTPQSCQFFKGEPTWPSGVPLAGNVSPLELEHTAWPRACWNLAFCFWKVLHRFFSQVRSVVSGVADTVGEREYTWQWTSRGVTRAPEQRKSALGTKPRLRWHEWVIVQGSSKVFSAQGDRHTQSLDPP